MPASTEAPEYASVSPPEMQTNLLLDNVSKIERKTRAPVRFVERDLTSASVTALKEQRESARFVSKFVQAATSRKMRKNSHRKSTISSLTPDTLSLDSSTVGLAKRLPHDSMLHCFICSLLQSAESKEQQKFSHPNVVLRDLVNDDGMKARLSEDESNESAFTDNGKPFAVSTLDGIL